MKNSKLKALVNATKFANVMTDNTKSDFELLTPEYANKVVGGTGGNTGVSNKGCSANGICF